jgi:hypothetical protein
LTVELGREENRDVLQDGVRATMVLHFTLQLFRQRPFVAGETRTSTIVDLRSSKLGSERFGRHVEHLRNGRDRGPLGLLVLAAVQHHLHGSFTQLG